MSNSLFTASYASTTCVSAGQVLHAVLVAPAGLRDQPLRLAPDGSARERRRPLANRAGHQHVVAEELELIAQPLLQLRQRRDRSGCAGSSSAAERCAALRDAARSRRRTSGSDRGSTESDPDAAVPEWETGPDRDAWSGRRWLNTPSRRACCASCRRTSACAAGGTGRSPMVRRPRSRRRRWPRVADGNFLTSGCTGGRGVHRVEELLAHAVGHAPVR